jgi:hypothetical protein
LWLAGLGQPFAVPAAQVLGYSDQKVIGKCTNCLASEVALTSFEPNAPGGWGYNQGMVIKSAAKHSFTGYHYYPLSNGNVTKAIAPLTGKTLLVTYWTVNNSQTVNGQSGTLTRTAMIDGVTWRQYRHTLSNPSGITISGAGIIDELRLYPIDADVATYAYDDEKGLATQCDAMDRATYHEYDAFNRLSVVRDFDYRIQKSYCYGQWGETHNCNQPLFFNDQQQETLARTDCMAGFVAGNATYIVPANTYYSFTSKADANQKAIADLNANKQMFANLNGGCNILYQSDDYSGVYYSSLCTWPQSPQPIYVSVPSGAYTSIVSKEDANAQALAYAQNYANTHGQCNSQVNIQYNHYGWGYVSLLFTKTDTYEQYYFDIYSSGSGLLAGIPSGNYDITIYAANWHSFYWCGYFQSGSYISFYNVPVSEFCNVLDIY